MLNAAPYAGGVLAKGANTYKKYAYQDASDEDALARSAASRKSATATACRPAPRRCSSPCATKRVTSTVIGVSKPERVAQTLEWADWSIPDAMWDELLALPFATDDPEATRDYKPG